MSVLYVLFGTLGLTECPITAEICFLSTDINDYPMQSQGKTSIPGVDDGEEGYLTDVSDMET